MTPIGASLANHVNVNLHRPKNLLRYHPCIMPGIELDISGTSIRCTLPHNGSCAEPAMRHLSWHIWHNFLDRTKSHKANSGDFRRHRVHLMYRQCPLSLYEAYHACLFSIQESQDCSLTGYSAFHPDRRWESFIRTYWSLANSALIVDVGLMGWFLLVGCVWVAAMLVEFSA